jgi:hypothetical protein
MPTYIDRTHPNCRIECTGAGGAAFIPPYTCVRWCGDPRPLAKGFSSNIRKSGWDFRSSLDAILTGNHARRVASTLLQVEMPLKAPFQVSRDIRDIHRMGTDAPGVIFFVSWKNLGFKSALRSITVAMKKAIRQAGAIRQTSRRRLARK